MDSGAKGVGDALRDGPARLARKLARGRTKGTLLGLRDVDGGRDGGGVDVGTLGGKRRGQQLQRATGNLVGKSGGGRSRREAALAPRRHRVPLSRAAARRCSAVVDGRGAVEG